MSKWSLYGYCCKKGENIRIFHMYYSKNQKERDQCDILISIRISSDISNDNMSKWPFIDCYFQCG